MGNEIKMKIELLAPGTVKILQYTGFHPSRLLTEIPESLKKILKITGADLFEDVFKWDKSGDPVEFYAIWRARDDKHDGRSPIWVKVTVHGKQSAKDKSGSVTVKIDGWIETTLPYKNIIHKAFLKAYTYFFYDEQIRRYMELGKIYMERIEDDIRALFNLMTRTNKSQ